VVQLGIAILLDGEAHNTIRRLQLAVAQACGDNPALRQTPHVTLKQPFHAGALDPVEAYFDEMVASTPAFDVQLQGLGQFEEDRVIYAAVAPDERLDALRQSVLRDLGNRFRVKPRDVEGEQYRFHATIGYNLTEEQFAAARHALVGIDLSLRFTADTLGLFYYTGDTWIAYKRSRLASSPG
jgi:2'-5' RNA ligase